MSKVLMESLKMDLPGLAELIRSKGRKGDAILAHISPKEAALLKRKGGAGTTNPETGLPEFYGEDGGYDPIGASQEGFTYAGPEVSAAAPSAPAPDTTGYGLSYGQPQAQPFDTSVSGYTPGAYADYVSKQTAPLSTYGQLQPGISAVPGPVQVPLAQTPQIGFAGATQPAAPADQSLLTKAGDYLTSEKGLGTLARLGLAGGLGVFGAKQAKKGAEQAQQAQAETQAIASPYQEQGKTLVGAAQRGELTPASQQVLQAYKAQQAQGVANRGGVGQAQADAATANLYNTLLDNQYKYGLQVMQIGDQIALGAIKTGLQEDQLLSQATNNFYTQLASLAAGGTMGGQTIRIGGV
jgi:hypothetical protein